MGPLSAYPVHATAAMMREPYDPDTTYTGATRCRTAEMIERAICLYMVCLWGKFVANSLPLQAKLLRIFHYPCSRSTFEISSTPQIYIFSRKRKLFRNFLTNMDPLKIDLVSTFVANLLPLQTELTNIFNFPYPTSPIEISGSSHISHKTQKFQQNVGVKQISNFDMG